MEGLASDRSHGIPPEADSTTDRDGDEPQLLHLCLAVFSFVLALVDVSVFNAVCRFFFFFLDTGYCFGLMLLTWLAGWALTVNDQTC